MTMETTNMLSSLPAAQAKQRQVDEMSARLTQNLSLQVANAKPMPVLGGMPGPAVNGVARPFVGDDPELLKRTATVRKKNETLMQFYARTGVSAHQLTTLSRREIEKLVRLAESNEDMNQPQPRATKIPAKFAVTFDASGDLDGAYSKPRLPDNLIIT